MLDENTTKLLVLDYEKALAAIDKFDGQLFAIRNWVVTTVGAVLALGLSTQRWLVLVFGIVPIVFFWFLELMYKCFHEDAMMRSRDMERLIQKALEKKDTSLPSDYTFGIGHAFENPSLRAILWIVWNRKHITLFYLGLITMMVLGTLVVWLVN